MNYVIHNPFDDYKREMEETQKRARKYIEEINQNSIWEEGESPVENIQALRKSFDDLNVTLDKISDSFQQQVEMVEIIADSALKEAKSAKSISGSAEITAKSSDKIANSSNAHSWVAIGISILAIVIEFAANHKEICAFLHSLFNH